MSKNQLHIALVSNTSWSIYNFRIGLVRALISRGHHVYAVAPRDDYSDKLTAAGATYISLKMDAYSTSPLNSIKTFYRLLRMYRSRHFDQIIHYTIKPNIYGSIAAKLSGTPSIAIVTGLGRTFQFSGISQVIINTFYRLAAWCSDEVWFLNKNDRDLFISKGIVHENKTFVLPSEGVNTAKFIGTPLSRSDRKHKRFLFAGRLLKDKGVLEFVSAAKAILKHNHQVKFEIVGFVHPQNPMSIKLSQLEEWQRNGWINYLGSHEDIRPFINRADCLVFPSYYPEGISRILLEASSMSRPVITTDQVGCKEVVDHQRNGFLVQPKSVIALKEAIQLILKCSNEELDFMGSYGRNKVKNLFDERIIIDIYMKRIFSYSSSTMKEEEERIKQIKKH